MDSLYNDVLLTKDFDKHPLAKAYALESIDQARGGSNKHVAAIGDWLASAVSGISRIGTGGKFILPHKATRDAIQLGNKVQTVLLLGAFHVPFLTAQLFQHLSTVPALQAKFAKSGKGLGEINKAIMEAQIETYLEMIHHGATRGKNPLISKLDQMGALEATFKYDWSTYAADALKDYRNTLQDHLTGLSTMSALEKYGVRTPAALMFMKTLEKLGYDEVARSKTEKFEVAKELTDQYMASNKWFEKAHVFGRSGMPGSVLGLFQNFSTTWLGMFREYTKLMAEKPLDPKYVAPFASFMAINLALGGLMGLIGTKEYNQLVALSNKYMDTNLSYWEEGLKANIKSKAVRYGIISDYTGSAAGTTFNNPTLTGSFGAGAQFYANIANLAITGTKYALDSASDVDMREAAKGLAPRSFGHYLLEREATPKGVPYERNKGGAQRQRTERDWTARKFGTYSLDEYEYKTDTFIEERAMKERSRRFSKKMQLIGDRLLTNRSLDAGKIVTELAKKEGYTSDEIYQGIKRELEGRLVEPQAKAQGQVKSSRQALIYNLLQELK